MYETASPYIGGFRVVVGLTALWVRGVEMDIPAKSALLMDVATGKVLQVHFAVFVFKNAKTQSFFR